MEFCLSHFVKEAQLQHGLRAEDHARYHRYLTNRLATLRQQLNLSNDKKRFLHKEVTASGASDVRHLMLLALYAERCWAAAEAMQEMRQSAKEARGDGARPKGGVPPSDQYRKRLNKAVKWAAQLRAVVQVVGSERTRRECDAYLLETRGRAAIAHGQCAEAKALFIDARAAYYGLRHDVTSDARETLRMRVNELDDRVVYCMQRLGEDTARYNPSPILFADETQDTVTSVELTRLTWNGRVLNVTSMKVKEALREARNVPVEAAEAKALEGGSATVPLGQTNKVLELMDRRIGYYNDALAHAQQDLRAAHDGPQQTERQLLVHYFLFHVSHETVRRALFLVEVMGRRFYATERALSSSSGAAPPTRRAARQRRGEQLPAAQYASPMEVVHVYKTAAEELAKVELLPGVAGMTEVEELNELCQAGRRFFTGEAWRVSGRATAAATCYRAALAMLPSVGTNRRIAALRARIERAALRLSAEAILAHGGDGRQDGGGGVGGGGDAVVPYLSEATTQTAVAVAQNVMPFPPDFQTVPCKPTFVDIASTQVHFTLPAAAEQNTERAKTAVDLGPNGVTTRQQDGDASATTAERKWRWKWGWGSS